MPHSEGQDDMNGEKKAELVGVALAAVVAIVVGQGPFSLWGSIAGIVLLLFIHSQELYDIGTSLMDKFAFGAIWALCFVLAIGVFPMNFVPVNETPTKLVRDGETWDFIMESPPPNPFDPRDVVGFAIWLAAMIAVVTLMRFSENRKKKKNNQAKRPNNGMHPTADT